MFDVPRKHNEQAGIGNAAPAKNVRPKIRHLGLLARLVILVVTCRVRILHTKSRKVYFLTTFASSSSAESIRRREILMVLGKA